MMKPSLSRSSLIEEVHCVLLIYAGRKMLYVSWDLKTICENQVLHFTTTDTGKGTLNFYLLD